MDVLGITQIAGPSPELQGRSGAKTSPQKGPDQYTGASGQEKNQDPAPQDIHDTSKISPRVLDSYHGLDMKSARALSSEVARDITQTPAWTLAEIQPVANNAMFRSAYV